MSEPQIPVEPKRIPFEVAALRSEVINGVPETERALLEKRFGEQLQRVDAMVSAREAP